MPQDNQLEKSIPMVKNVTAIIKLWVFHSEGKKIVWTPETWQGTMPDCGEYDPLLLQRDGDESPDAHQLFKLEFTCSSDGERECIYERAPVARAGWFYRALPKWGFVKSSL